MLQSSEISDYNVDILKYQNYTKATVTSGYAPKGGERMGMRRFAYGYEGPKDERSMAAAKDIAELMARKGFSYAEVDAILEQARWILLQEYVPARPLSYAERDS